MESELWKQVDNLLQAALERPAAQRADFLGQACAGDQKLEQEIRSLLASQHIAGNFQESPAIEVAAQAMAAQYNPDPLAGQTAPVRSMGRIHRSWAVPAPVRPPLQATRDASATSRARP